MKKIVLTKDKGWAYVFSPEVTRADINHIVRVLTRRFQLTKRRARLNRLKAGRQATLDPSEKKSVTQESTNGPEEQTS